MVERVNSSGGLLGQYYYYTTTVYTTQQNMETEYRNTTIPMYGYYKAYYTENSVKQNMET